MLKLIIQGNPSFYRETPYYVKNEGVGERPRAQQLRRRAPDHREPHLELPADGLRDMRIQLYTIHNNIT